MQKTCIIILLLLLILSTESFGQNITNKSIQDTVSPPNQLPQIKDSSVSGLHDSTDEPSNYLQVGFGIGNKIYSAHNNFINSQQLNPIVALMPAVGYFLKSGFSLTTTSYFASENNKLGIIQYAIMPAFETNPKSKFDFSASYTYYIEANKYATYSSPIQNDFYASLVDKKSWVQPGIAIGYSTGKSYQNYYLDTTINRVKKDVYDSSTNNLRAFSPVLLVQHSFQWNSLFDSADKLTFVPMLMLNFGSTVNEVKSKTNYTSLLNRLVKKGEIPKLKNSQTEFTLESPGIDLDATYEIGQLTIEPELILDYYLPPTTFNRFTYVYSITFNYGF
jgi:hypothetical protein